VLWYGSFDAWVEDQILPGIMDESLDRADIVVVVAALRAWEEGGLYAL
jgi:hypothetical protein